MVVSSASAAFAFDSASCALCSNSGLVNSNITSPDSTFVPGQIKIFSTLASVVVGIQRNSSGTSVPRPRTCRTIGPRFTVSIQTLERSTLGAAGFNRDKANVARINPTALAEIIKMRRFRFFAATPSRGTSMEERLGVKPLGLTMVESSSFWGCGVTSNLKRQRAAKLDHCAQAGDDRHRSGGDQRPENCGVAQKVVVRFAIEIVAADVAQRFRCRCFCAVAGKISQLRSLIIVINEREFPRVLVCDGGWFHNFFPFVSSEKRFDHSLDSKVFSFPKSLLQRACHAPKQSPKSLMISD